MFVVRAAKLADLPDVERLAGTLDSVNLPNDAAALVQVLTRSAQSFEGSADDPAFLFALEDLEANRVVGVSMIIARHGTPADPHHYYKLDIDERYSVTLGTMMRHPTLEFKRSFTPHTEIGALILDPSYRGHPAKLGKLLSFSRFLYIARFPDRFCQSVQAELLPPFEPDGTSRLWNWLGHKFTGLDYLEADRLSRENNEFMQSLFPPGFIYTSLMPEEVQSVIGSVGDGTKGVAKMLRSIGFAFNNHIDPFDGGPHFEAKTENITLVDRAQEFTASEKQDADSSALIGIFKDGTDPRIVLGPASDADGRIGFSRQLFATLGTQPGETVFASVLHPPQARV